MDKKETEIQRKQKDALGKLWKYYGLNKKRMAEAFGVSRMTVHNWFVRGRISATKAIIAEELTGGEITKEELRPDVAEWFGL